MFPPDGNGVRESDLRAPTDWQWFAPVLLATAKAAPKIMVRQLARLVMVPQRDTMAALTVTLLADWGLAIFGNRMRNLMELLSQEVQVGDPAEDEYLWLVRERAQQWLRDQGVQAAAPQ